MNERHQLRAREIVQRISYVTVATVSAHGAPWNTPVYSAYDDHGTFVWSSSPHAQHSRNIEQNGKAFLVIYDSTVPAGSGAGVYVEATAAAVTEHDAMTAARRALTLRAGKPLDDGADRLLDAGMQRLYQAAPRRVWLNDFENDANGSFIRDIRVELPIACLAGLVTWRG